MYNFDKNIFLKMKPFPQGGLPLFFVGHPVFAEKEMQEKMGRQMEIWLRKCHIGVVFVIFA